MITIYVDPSDANQVMAYYNGCRPGNPRVWTEQGFVEILVSKEHPEYRALMRNQRDCRFQDDLCTPRINPVQPVPKASVLAFEAARGRAKDKLKALGLSDEELQAFGLT